MLVQNPFIHSAPNYLLKFIIQNAEQVAGGERDLRSLYLPPFKRAIKDAGALSIMSAYQ
jgi:hypothetical protein